MLIRSSVFFSELHYRFLILAQLRGGFERIIISLLYIQAAKRRDLLFFFFF